MVTGATGLIGKRLIEFWGGKHKVTAVGRSKSRITEMFGDRVVALTWDDLTESVVKSASIIINLAGANVAAKRWTPAFKQEMFDSRVKTTQKIVDLIAPLGKAAPALFNASAIGVYGIQKQDMIGLPPALDESSPINCDHPDDFLSQLGCAWEGATQKAVKSGVRVVLLRLAVVLATDDGAFPLLEKPVRFFVGARLATGEQAFSWIELDDVVRGIDFILENQSVSGPVNFVAPGTVTQYQFVKTLGALLKRPVFFTLPAPVIKLMMGSEMAETLIIEGQHVYPKKLLALNFEFKYPTLDLALKHLLQMT